jgi:serine protease Do
MKRYSIFLCIVLILAFPSVVFSQQGAAALRDYVGLINQTYHPGIVSYFERAKEELIRQNETDAVRNIEIFLSGGFGSGFLYNDARGNLYVITNNHVVAQAHTLSITFERSDGTKRRVENLRIIATDEEADLAILLVPAQGERPFVNRGLNFLTRQIEEGEDVFSAGFPGLGITPLWQFGRGMVSNASARFPRSINDNTLMGPFIQHTAQVDLGNSGGPLLVVQGNAPSGYAVAGINTLKAISRQAANYAIPVNTVQAFINSALNPRPETFRAALDERLELFVNSINGKTSFYPHIAGFLSAACIGENAEYAFEEMWEKAGRQVWRTFIEKCEDSIVGAMSIAIAWTIEESMRNRVVFSASIKEVTGSDEEYTVIFTINNRDVSSVWIREYGNWRIKTFGTAASGDTERLIRRQAERDAVSKLRLNSNFRVEAGYANLFDKAPAALYICLDFSILGIKMYYVNPDFFVIGAFFGWSWAIPAGKIGFTPYLNIGIDYQVDREYEDFKPDFAAAFPASLNAQLGLRLTTSFVEGVFLGISFQYNLFNMHAWDPFDWGDAFNNPMNMALTFSIGYAF